ncbi:MAG: hypothetical protein AABW79_03000 [Nanoarchaeota archaeon]
MEIENGFHDLSNKARGVYASKEKMKRAVYTELAKYRGHSKYEAIQLIAVVMIDMYTDPLEESYQS